MQLETEPWCADCLAVGIYKSATEVHHEIRHKGNRELFIKSPLTSLCRDCHQRRTLGQIRGERENYYPEVTENIPVPVIMVCGPPASGKNTFVEQHWHAGDILIDLDQIIIEMTGQPIYSDIDQDTLRDAFRKRNALLEALQNKVIKGRVWFIVGAGDPRDRMMWRTLLKPQEVYILNVPAAVCIDRIEKDSRRGTTARESHKRAVVSWWNKYIPLYGELEINVQA